MRNGRGNLQVLAEKFLQQSLDESGRLGVRRPFLLQRVVAETAESDRATRELLPVFVAVAVVNGTREAHLRSGRGGEHLQAGGAHAAGQLGQKLVEASVDRDDD